jgi:hypothetical protein
MRLLSILLFVALPCMAAVQRADVVGKWYCGDGTGYNIYLDLQAGGTYQAVWHGCLGEYGSAKGKWREASGRILLTPSDEKEMMKGHLTALLVIEEKSEIRLLRREDDRHRANPFFGFRKRKIE